jgi:hypothetical protein
MQDNNWKILPGQQLSLNLPEVANSPQPDPKEAFAQKQRAAELLRELARALGEQRAAMDLEDYCRSLVLP